MLYLWMPEGQGQWLWRLDQEWRTAENIDQLVQAVQLIYKEQQAVVFFPSQSAQFYTHQLSKVQFKKLGHAGIQYLVEEYCIDSVDQLDILYDHHVDQLNSMAILKSTREMYQQSLALLPWQIQALLPDYLITDEPAQDALHITQIGEALLSRWSKYRGFKIEDLSLIEYLPKTATQIYFYDVDAVTEQAVKAYFGDEVDYQHKASHYNDVLKAKQHPFNIAAKSKRKSQTGFNYWKACAALLCVAILGQISYDGLRWWKYKQLSDQTSILAVQQYQQWFPNETRVNEQNVRSQFTSKLRMNAAADTQALQLISRVAPILQQANIQAEQMDYQEQKLTLSLIAGSAQVINQLSEQFTQQGFRVELGSIRNQGDKVIGLIKVQ